ncbi:hypothetical protein SKAU_G00161820 [Synaphobranchus kaupii]|uniref:THAP-type domain-containing protein n=1 Tax=Synaphobranchus kaupii TaxID=118154 RepID=A0A9Q1IZZ0_SYNKA|nr:hypothetical protein SKAU_G00161820 [Synaphobranchus kaupii]
MPQTCAAFGCTNRRIKQTKDRGITFHKFPKDPDRRRAWVVAVRRKDFEPIDTTVLCSCHFEADDFDRTGQNIRLREFAVPSVFPSFPDHLKKNLAKARSTRTSTQAVEASVDAVPVSKGPEQLNSSTLDHDYGLDPDQVKCKLIEAQARVEELQRELRNAKDQELQLKLDRYSDLPVELLKHHHAYTPAQKEFALTLFTWTQSLQLFKRHNAHTTSTSSHSSKTRSSRGLPG